MQLCEQYRPRSWSEVVGQDKALAKIANLRERGLGGRAYWISGQPGTGKTTIAKLIAAEVCPAYEVSEIDAKDVDKALVSYQRDRFARSLFPLCHTWIVNEAHKMKPSTVVSLLTALEPIPDSFVWIFTTTNEGERMLFDKGSESNQTDVKAFSQRCNILPLARRDLAKPFAERARMIAQQIGRDGKPIEAYIKLARDCGNSLREMLQRIDEGAMVD